MCGRVVQKTPLAEIRVLLETVNPVPNAAATYNGAPTQNLAVVRLDAEGRRSLDLMRWGLIPSWAKDKAIGPRLINAMAETVATKPAFRDAFRRRRCLVPVDFFYEWRKTGSGKQPSGKQPSGKQPSGKQPSGKQPSGKQPYAIGLADGAPMALAGLWERWTDPQDGATLRTFTVITGPPNEAVAPIHNRMPVVLPRESWRRWLGEDRTETDELQALLRPYPAEAMRAYPVAARVGNVRNNDAELLTPMAA
jgi:putative SOS response-associated peptidase YedK